uniref:Uncharacterized protein n=1 Tax=Anguilla anguilla TaxID=7936 RepID=A0A0E9PAG6_ANGAN
MSFYYFILFFHSYHTATVKAKLIICDYSLWFNCQMYFFT